MEIDRIRKGCGQRKRQPIMFFSMSIGGARHKVRSKVSGV
jgi:hypothetical protein